MSDPIHDVIVIGSGPAGSTAAAELTAQGLRVLLLEAGPNVTPADFDPARGAKAPSDINIWERARATLRGQGVQARAAFFREQFSHLYVRDREHPYTTPRGEPFLWIRGRQSGGRMHTFGRVLLRWTDDDFRLATRTGSGVDWPVDYATMAPFYDEVETALGLYGNADGVETLPDGKYLGPAPLTPAEQDFRDKVEGRWASRRVISWRFIAPSPDRVPAPLRRARASGMLTERHDSIVRRILTGPDGKRATGVEVIGRLSREVETLRAGAVVLCASPIESVRLLLASGSGAHPQGLGNSSGVLGRYFMDQLPCLAFGTYPAARGWTTADATPEDPFYGRSGGIFLPRFGAEAGLPGGNFDYQGSIARYPVPDGAASRMSFFGFGMMQPDADNRITLDPRRRDAWGIAAPHVRCVMGAADRTLLERQMTTLLDMLRETGGAVEFIGSPLGLREFGRGAFPDADPFSRLLFRKWFGRTMIMGAAIHETGGARMGAEPGSSVLNPFGQSWDVPNLYVTDASAFCGSGVSGTTLTVMAQTLRACRHLAGELGAGRA